MIADRGIHWDPLWRHDFAEAKQASARRPVFGCDAAHQIFHYRKGRGWESTLVAFDAATGGERWRQVFGHVANEPVIAPDGRIVLSAFDGEVSALAPSGGRLWSARCGEANLGKPCIAGDKVVVAEIGGSARHTYGLDLATGAIRWRFENGGHAYPIAATATLAVHATARRDLGQTFAVLGRRGALHILDASTGRPAGPLLSVENGRDIVGGIAGSSDALAVAFRRTLEVYRRADEVGAS